jgi:hypothetical protein
MGWSWATRVVRGKHKTTSVNVQGACASPVGEHWEGKP